MNHTFPHFILIALMVLVVVGCKQQTQRIERTNWAVVDVGKVQVEIRKRIRQENPFPSSLLHRIQANDRESSSAKNKIDEIMAEAIRHCAHDGGSERVQGKSGPRLDINIGKQRSGSRYWYRIVNSKHYDMKCVDTTRRKVKAQSNIAELKAMLESLREEAEELKDEKRAYHAKNKKRIEVETDSVISKYAEGRYDLLLGSHAPILFNNKGVSVDVTDAIVKTIRQLNDF